MILSSTKILFCQSPLLESTFAKKTKKKLREKPYLQGQVRESEQQKISEKKRGNKSQNFEENITRLKRGLSQLLYWLAILKIPEISEKNILATENYVTTKYRLHHGASSR